METEPYNATAYEFEKSFKHGQIWEFVSDNKMLSVWSSVAYVVVIFGGRWIMERKERYGLSNALALWSGMLAIFSVMGTVRMWPEIIHVLRYEGLHASACTLGYMEHPVTHFWTALFILSKIIELGDTVFIVLRKQPLIFLHWYHHITVLLYTWYSYIEQAAPGRWFICMNFGVHAVMYTYYALRAMKFRVPNQIRMVITLLQLIQMIVGCGINFYVYYAKSNGRQCFITYENIYYSFLMYFSYFVLFAKFFYDSYVSPPVRSTPRVADEKKVITKHTKPMKAD